MCLLFLGNCLKIVLQINTIIIQFEVNSDINTLVRFYIELTLWDYNNYKYVHIDHHLKLN